jgi:subfamily B ATP-binding cassette protein MsbA
LQISHGECVAFCGPTGAGKTTFIHLLLRFFRPQRGTITLDEYDLRDLSPAWVREQIAVVSQDLMLFHDTIMNNIRYSRPDATEEMVINAAQQAGIHDEVMNFPEGYNALVGERGGKLSGGQKQRIAIARALIRNSPIIILDEPTAHLDFETEERLLIEFMRICQGRTMIVITHRPGLLHLAQRIYEVKDGMITEKLKRL